MVSEAVRLSVAGYRLSGATPWLSESSPGRQRLTGKRRNGLGHSAIFVRQPIAENRKPRTALIHSRLLLRRLDWGGVVGVVDGAEEMFFVVSSDELAPAADPVLA